MTAKANKLKYKKTNHMDNQDVNEARLGRPTDYCSHIAESICAKIARGQSLRKICKLDSMPSVPTVMRWLLKHEDFREQYRVSREIQADTHFDELIDLADEATPETANVQKLRIWARQWIMARINAKKYGEKVAAVNVNNTVQNIPVITEERAADIRRRHQEALEAIHKQKAIQ